MIDGGPGSGLERERGLLAEVGIVGADTGPDSPALVRGLPREVERPLVVEPVLVRRARRFQLGRQRHDVGQLALSRPRGAR